ncbi:MAG: nucleoside deaminase [Deltaproteobacteria bacterium]|jgi:tRNA(adenine34) deaminase|nr:nucleoside deaminase [Deltaproteobacteria bacterium]
MAEALRQALEAKEQGEVPVGALVLDAAGRIIGRGRNSPVGSNDPVAHAEIVALRQAAVHIDNYRLNGCCLVVTLEPCLMCAGAIVQARLDGVVYGAPDDKAGTLDSRLEAFDLSFHNHRPWHMGGILEAECSALLQAFFAERRRL